MKVLVTGAAGQVGCRLVRQLLDLNHEVRGTLLPDDPVADRIAGLDVDLCEGDLTDPNFVKSALEGVDAVIHTANLVGPHFETNTSINLQVTRACADAADRLDRYIYISSSGVYPNNGENIACAYHPVDELHPKRPDNEYSLSKFFGEQLAERASRETGLRYSIVRPSHVLSGTKLFGQFTVGRVIGLLQKGQRPGSELYMPEGTELWHQVEENSESPDQPCTVTDLEGRPWMYQPNDARDIAHCIVCALQSDTALGEAFNGGAPEPFSFVDGARLLGEIRGIEPLEIKLPVRNIYDHAIGKAKSMIGYQPKGDLSTMMASAKGCEDGETDYTWEDSFGAPTMQ
jgi:nucleoside-diphosphate-sugar epimerase